MKVKENNELLYLNQKRIDVIGTKEFFWGKKILKYVRLFKKIKIFRIVKELKHDIYAFLKKNVDHYKIIDFSKNAIKEFDDKVVVYTCIYGGYDKILEPLSYDENCEYYIFTDNELSSNSIWKKADDSLIPKECDTPAKKNRYVKMFPHKFFDCHYSIYIDGNLQIVANPSMLVQQEINTNKTGIAMHLSPRENCIYEEARTVYLVGKINKVEKNSVLKMYKEISMPRHFGMFECNVIVRNHQNKQMFTIMEYWWEKYKNGVKRDQLYFTYVLYRLGYSFDDVMNFGSSVNANVLFIREEHI